KPKASTKQFIELAVNIPEQEPQVGQALRSIFSLSSSLTFGLAADTIASTKSSLIIWSDSLVLPASIGPPETKMAGIFSRRAAINMPGVILSQLEIQTIASAQWPLTIYSTESAMISRDGRLYNIPPWPMAMPSSTAMVLNSLAMPPASSMLFATNLPKSRRCTWPRTNSQNEHTSAIIRLPKPVYLTPLARH